MASGYHSIGTREQLVPKGFLPRSQGANVAPYLIENNFAANPDMKGGTIQNVGGIQDDDGDFIIGQGRDLFLSDLDSFG